MFVRNLISNRSSFVATAINGLAMAAFAGFLMIPMSAARAQGYGIAPNQLFGGGPLSEPPAQEPKSVPLKGNWITKIQIQGRPEYLSIYSFNDAGRFTETVATIQGQIFNSVEGNFTVSGNQITIRWQDGTLEQASVQQVDKDTIIYKITNHNSDAAQVGMTCHFKRLPEQPVPPPAPDYTKEQLDDMIRRIIIEIDATQSLVSQYDKYYRDSSFQFDKDIIFESPSGLSAIYKSFWLSRKLDAQQKLNQLRIKLAQAKASRARLGN